MMVGDMLQAHPEMPEEVNNINNVGYENNGGFAYDDLFPALPHSAPPVQRNVQQATNKLRVGSSLHTQVSHRHLKPPIPTRCQGTKATYQIAYLICYHRWLVISAGGVAARDLFLNDYYLVLNKVSDE